VKETQQECYLVLLEDIDPDLLESLPRRSEHLRDCLENTGLDQSESLPLMEQPEEHWDKQSGDRT
jgi:hypothetical protein